ncbi:site-specific DNA-methyltransferase [Rhizobacter sp. OV335]|uniref:site-specific DNA-methyltransferase n=1 Tax=Rhizobacter sp. OV335 TaxID=1500264 RepID=UPI0009220AA9|nr:site-specific DNA-methyltransferase [Rhizobacter sp. OV335]SHM72632.1 adenine-specific DNA-methyltransferase [Rhizobacter sp. OV335]
MSIRKIEPGMQESQSADILADNVARLKALFPELVTEGAKGPAINIDVLKALVGDATATDTEEKYGLSWHGKRAARQLALTPSAGTLRPCPEESVDWETTQNLMIEGDNLEVLKLLQKSYAGKVKLIYIDPPYNTGKDFVYPDNFQDSIRNYLELTGQVEGGRKISSNTEASGRFHTDWLSMLYPRVKLARSLLRGDGILFVSIDSTEVANLRLLLDEVFGEECFIIDLIWKKRDGAPNDRNIGSVHEHILVYGKALTAGSTRTLAEDRLNLMPRTEKADAEYQEFREPGGPDPRGKFRKIDTTANAKGGRDVASLHFGVRNPTTGEMCYPRDGTCWRHSKEEMDRLQADGRLYWGVNGTATTPMRKLFLSEAKPGMTTPSILPDMPLNQHAARELEVLFGQKSVFDTPKPTELLKLLAHLGSGRDDICLDFFAGSGSMGEAVMMLNATDGGQRRYVLVQLPEPIADSSESRISRDYCLNMGRPPIISELTKERMRRSGQRIKTEGHNSVDVGFRAFRLDTSNLKAWAPRTDDVGQSLLDHLEHVKSGRSTNDVLYELLLKLGLDLCVPKQVREIAGKAVHSIGGGVLLACLDERISVADAETLALGIVSWSKEQATAGEVTCVFLDSAFENDVAKTNLAAILEQHGITKVRSL